MSTIEKLKQAAALLESAYYDLNISLNADISIQRSVSVAQDLTEDAINYLEDEENAKH